MGRRFFKNYIKKNMRRIFRSLVIFSSLSFIFIIIAIAGVFGAYYYVQPSLPKAETIREIPLETPLKIYTRDGRLIDEIGERKRIIISYDELPQHLINAFIAAEDRRFFEHSGIDYQGIIRAAIKLISTGKISGGGSTLTQQLARDYFLNRRRIFTRKILEIFLAFNIEDEFSKEEIITLFVNKMFFGQRSYGVAAAAQVFFGKTISNLSIAEAATLAGVLPAPSNYNPVRSPTLAKIRRDYVLSRMLDLKYINRLEYDEAISTIMVSKLHGNATEVSAPYIAEMVRTAMIEKYGRNATRDGYTVTTTIDSKTQSAATYSLRRGLLEYTQRQGYRGPINSVNLSSQNVDLPFDKWPENIRLELENINDLAVLKAALVTNINFDNSVNIIFKSGERSLIPWQFIKWAKQFKEQGYSPPPKNANDVLSQGDMIYVMQTTTGGYALAEIPLANGGAITMDPFDGAIIALSGGFDYSINKVNHVLNKGRQPGSSFKPFIYSAALEQGANASTILLDAPVVMSSTDLEQDWRPSNYSGKFYGEQRLREALVRSMNLATVRLLMDKIGIEYAVNHIKKFGFSEEDLPKNGGLALGAGSASPLDMAQAYSVFANGGYKIEPYIIETIRDSENRVVYRNDTPIVCERCEINLSISEMNVDLIQIHNDEQLFVLQQMAEIADVYKPDAKTSPTLFENINLANRIMSKENAYLIQDMLKDVIRRGTGVRANRELRRRDLSGKTGTTNDYRDAWFAGFNNDLTSVVWVGNDNYDPLGSGEQGSRTALPIWIELMRVALKSSPQNITQMPNNMTTVRISKNTGCPADPDTKDEIIFEIFSNESLPNCDNDDESINIFD